MKFLFDWLPVICFFVAYKLAGMNPDAAQHFINTYMSSVVSGGSVAAEQSPIVLATLIGILATIGQITWLKLRKQTVTGTLWVTLVLFVVFGGLTIYLHDEVFIKWKLSILYWLFALGLLASDMLFKKNLMRQSMQEIFQLPDQIWTRLNLAWVVFFLVMGVLNWYLAFVLFKGDTDAWVNFKTFGITGIMFVFIVGQTVYLSRHIKDQA
ncbi:septation protein A [Duganella sp. FT94W]|uniref:Inner membrane-spanning protein YciB n=1 Tax=Duganella lactea TaxID=2692173 RepID=A0ABW9V8P9_9BURK|nr:septation protein A [Duganella lactea]MYM35127.1 septation protein A [Duganella lactea]